MGTQRAVRVLNFGNPARKIARGAEDLFETLFLVE